MTNNILSFGSFITEAFDNPYRYTGGAGGPRSGTIKYKFFTSEKDEIEVTFEKLEWSDEEYTWMIAFDRDGRDNVTGEGDAMRIFATVLAILKDFTKKHKPPVIGFSAFKSAEDLVNKKGGKKGSREKLYLRMVKKFAPKVGYDFSSRTDSKMTDFELRRR
jgi:hypothetical protein